MKSSPFRFVALRTENPPVVLFPTEPCLQPPLSYFGLARSGP